MSTDDKDIREYTPEIEDLFIRFMISEPELFVRCKSIIDANHFEHKKNRKAISFIKEHTDEYNTLPSREQIKAIVGKDYEEITDLNDNHYNWFLAEYECFARHKQLEWVILNSGELLEKGNYNEVEKRVKEAVQIGLVKDLGLDYFDDPKTRLENFRKRDNLVSTGWKSLDYKLYGGVSRGDLMLFLGQSGAGKSLFLQNLSVNWALMGYNVVYITLELSEDLCAMRLDAMSSGYATNEIMKNIDNVHMKIRDLQRKNDIGTIQIKQMKNGSNSNDIRAYLKEYEVQTGRKVDAVLVDYLDLCAPNNLRVSPSDLFVKDKYVSEELRNLAIESNCLLATASQLNRSSYDEIEFGHQHIAGGKSKIDTSDNVIGIFTTHTMRENGRYQIQLMKTRSSAGVGSNIDLDFNIKSLRISDMEQGEEGATDVQTKGILDSLKKKSVVRDENKDEEKQEPGDILNKGSQLRDMIKKRR